MVLFRQSVRRGRQTIAAVQFYRIHRNMDQLKEVQEVVQRLAARDQVPAPTNDHIPAPVPARDQVVPAEDDPSPAPASAVVADLREGARGVGNDQESLLSGGVTTDSIATVPAAAEGPNQQIAPATSSSSSSAGGEGDRIHPPSAPSATVTTAISTVQNTTAHTTNKNALLAIPDMRHFNSTAVSPELIQTCLLNDRYFVRCGDANLILRQTEQLMFVAAKKWPRLTSHGYMFEAFTEGTYNAAAVIQGKRFIKAMIQKPGVPLDINIFKNGIEVSPRYQLKFSVVSKKGTHYRANVFKKKYLLPDSPGSKYTNNKPLPLDTPVEIIGPSGSTGGPISGARIHYDNIRSRRISMKQLKNMKLNARNKNKAPALQKYKQSSALAEIATGTAVGAGIGGALAGVTSLGRNAIECVEGDRTVSDLMNGVPKQVGIGSLFGGAFGLVNVGAVAGLQRLGFASTSAACQAVGPAVGGVMVLCVLGYEMVQDYRKNGKLTLASGRAGIRAFTGACLLGIGCCGPVGIGIAIALGVLDGIFGLSDKLALKLIPYSELETAVQKYEKCYLKLLESACEVLCVDIEIVVDIRSDAVEDAVKKQYKRMWLNTHPDHKDWGSHDDFLGVQIAYAFIVEHRKNVKEQNPRQPLYLLDRLEEEADDGNWVRMGG